MAKNYAAAFNQASDSNSLEQRFFLKEEVTRGVFAPPVAGDFLFTLGGGSISASQALNSSSHRSGRHNNNTIKEKRVEEFSFSTYFNFDALAISGNAAIDTAVKALWRSALGRTTVGVSSEFIADPVVAPGTTFTLVEVGDTYSKQMIGGFIESFEIQLPGDGEAQASWTGAGGSVRLVGIGKSVTANAANAITLGLGEGLRFPVGSFVMVIEADGVTRSTDTPDGLPRRVTAVVGDVVTVDGAILTDSDGSVALTPVYLSYYEPSGASGIDSPQTGLVGDIISSDLPTGYCFRNLSISGNNNHERVNYCFGSDGLDAPFFVPAGRLDISVTAELNLSKALVGFYNKIVMNEPVDILAQLGPATGRRYEFELPRVIFQIPSIDVPETGSIPVSFEGMAYQTALDAGDEITVTVL